MIEFRLPSLGSDMDSGTLLEWRVVPGQVVHRGDIVAQARAVFRSLKAQVEARMRLANIERLLGEDL